MAQPLHPPNRPVVNPHSHFPPMSVSYVPGFVIDFETSIQDVIDVLMDHPLREIFVHGLRVIHRKLDLKTELD